MTEFVLPTDLLQGDLEHVITDYARADERSQQTSIGPSELGNDCERRVAMTLLECPKVNDDRDEWTSSAGTALHSWMEKAFLHANGLLIAQGLPARWLVEQTVEIRPGLNGHTDVYDIWTHTVLDHKFPGVTSIRKYRKATDPMTGIKGWPGQQYQWQAHTYGYGWAKMGFPVRKVAIAMYPRSGLIRDTWLWKETYSEDIAQMALDRMDWLLLGMNKAEGEGQLNEYMLGLSRDLEHCGWCAFFDKNSTDPLKGCKGPFHDPTHTDPRDMAIPGILM